ncbi:MAG: YbfB/YjiJ family MFS transporter [Alphaproteobacteria bacterium]|nr:YbfB/YjiJ family MFS transporter [Alphaproteobacteria bacterium]
MRCATAARRLGAGEAGPWRATAAGLSATLVGIGLARFAYTPLIPALVDAGWFSASDAAYLGAANLAGYLAGALLARTMAARASAPAVLRAMMVLATASFLASAAPLPFLWFFLWRFASGLAGGALMALAAPTVLPHIPPSRQGLAGGIIFTGVGLGIAASGTLVPLLLRLGLVETWLGLGMLSLLLTLLAWGGWPAAPAVAGTAPKPVGTRRRRSPAGLKSLYVEYGLNAVGLVPHMIFLVDFVARGLGRGIDAGAEAWVLFGLGAVLGPVLLGRLADRIGFAAALRLAYTMQAAAVALLAITAGSGWLMLSSLVVGAFVPGIVVLVLGRAQALVPPDAASRTAAWSVATAAFALGQAGGAYAFSFLFAAGGGHALLFALGAAALVLALAVNLVVGSGRRSLA